MKVVEITGKQEARLVDRPEPAACGEFVKVKVMVAPMCTEYKDFKDGNPSDCLGHEAAGEVVEVAQKCSLEPGARVVVMPLYPCGRCELCRSGNYIHCENGLDVEQETGCTTGKATYAQFLLKQDWLLLPIPDDISNEHGAMACCGLGPTFGAMERMRVDGLDTVMLTGMGPVGLGGIINAKHRGARVIAVEGHPFRAKLAKDLGADLVLAPDAAGINDEVMEFTQGRGVDKAIDCTGVVPAQQLLLDMSKRLGQVAFVGQGGELPVSISKSMIIKGLTLHGCWHFPLGGYGRIMRVIRDCPKMLDRLITHRFELGEAKAAWDLQLTGECGKVLLCPWP